LRFNSGYAIIILTKMKNSRNSSLLKFPGVDVVKASAGSGKTYALAKRYLQLIMDPRIQAEEMPLKTILAVTFTNKATLEMKQRIIDFLKNIALDSFTGASERKDILSSLSIDENKARTLASRVMDDIIGDYSFFKVETIDSFINTLLSGCAIHLRMGSGFRIKEDYRDYLEYSLNRIIDRVQADNDIREIFVRFLHSYLFVENRESWFVKQDILNLMRSLYNYSNIYGGFFKKSSSEAKTRIKKSRTVIDIIKKIRDDLPEAAHKGLVRAIDVFLEENKKGFNIDTLSAYFAREDFPIKKNETPPDKIVRLWKSLRKNLGKFCELESSVAFNPYIDIFNLVWDDFIKISGREDIIFLPELNNRAQSLVDDESVTVAEIYYRLATRFRHYLIDEFQDTSRLQWRNLSPLVDEALSSGGTLFYVGDKKQAIFRFRGGDASLFDSVEDDYKDFSPRETVLKKNYRSRKEIVEFNNQIFSEKNLERFLKDLEPEKTQSPELSQGDIRKVVETFAESKQEWIKENDGGYVRLETIKAGNIDERDSFTKEKLLSLIKGLTEEKRFSFGDIAILSGENKDVELLSSWLIEEGFPVESEKTLNIREHPLVKELISFLKFLNSPIDDLSFASFIQGSIFQKASGLSREEIQDFIFEIRERGKVNIYKLFRSRFNNIWHTFIEEFFKSVGFIPLYELMITIMRKFKVLDNFPEYQGFFMKLLDFIMKKEEDYAGISSFLEFFESVEEKDLYVNVTRENAIRINTIHKAKGLEFPVVIIPFLDIDINVGLAGRSNRLIKQFEDNTLELMQIKKAYRLHSKNLAEEYKKEYINSLIDELNKLYVALTRAEYEVYVFVPEKKGNSLNPACIFIPEENLERGNRKKYSEVKKKDEKEQVEELPVSHYSDWIGILKDEFIGHAQLINRGKILRGKVLHFILSCVGNLYDKDKGFYLKQVKEKTGLIFPYVKDTDEYIDLIKRLLDDEKLKPFFCVEKGTVYQEKEVVDSYGNTKRIDRLVITPREAWVIDYKSSKEEESQREQILEYIGIVESLYPGLKVKGFFIYLDTLSLEEIKK